MNEPKHDLSPEEGELLGEHAASLGALSAHHADCPRLEVLLAAQAGVLPEASAQKVATHLEKCNFCKVLLKDLAAEGLVGATAEEERRVRERVLAAAKPAQKIAKASRSFLATWLWRAIPVGALAAAAVAFFVWSRLHQAITPVSSPVAVGEPTAPSNSPPILHWEKLPIKLQAQSVLVWRGKPRTTQEKYASELTSALTYYRDNNFAEAAKRLAVVASDFPRGVEGQLYLGITQLRLGRDSDAIAPLRAAQQLGPEQSIDDATWYLALAYERVPDVQNARAELQKLCAGTSEYALRACAASQELSKQFEEKLRR